MAKAKKKPLTPQDFHELDDAKKIHVLTLTYMAVCVPGGFSKKSLFPLKHYFKTKVDRVHLQCFFDYLSSLTEPTEVSLYDLYERSTQHQLKLRMTVDDKAVEVPQYQSLLECLDKL